MLPEGFLSRMNRLLGSEMAEFLASYERPRNVGLRLNPLKTHTPPSLAQFGLKPVPWEPAGFTYDLSTRPGLSPYHEAGLYYLQEPSAMAPAALLDVHPGMRVLDLCAAPGGKATQLAARLEGTGLLVANEINPKRAKILSRNMERCAVANSLVLNEHPARLAERFPEYFDRILVDAPCSGEGMFRKEDAAVTDWSEETVAMCAARQSEILCSAAKMLAPGGKLIYSTCTFAPAENEGVISLFLKKHPEFSLLDGPGMFFSPGRPDWIENPEPGLEKTGRLWPHKLSGEGHFLALLQKQEDGTGKDGPWEAPGNTPAEYTEFLAMSGLTVPEGQVLSFGQSLFLIPEGFPCLRGLKVLRPGLELGECLKNRFEPAHGWAIWLKTAPNSADFAEQSPLLAQYLNGQAIPGSNTGWTLITVDGLSLGWAKGSGGMLKNHFPKGLRHLERRIDL